MGPGLRNMPVPTVPPIVTAMLKLVPNTFQSWFVEFFFICMKQK
jgi:hypothetical protein